jgi:hypothetical protein
MVREPTTLRAVATKPKYSYSRGSPGRKLALAVLVATATLTNNRISLNPLTPAAMSDAWTATLLITPRKKSSC